MRVGFADSFRKHLHIPHILHIRQNRPGKSGLTVLFLHGLGGTGDIWQSIITQLPSHVRIITIDLLGFGKSPKPTWATFNAKTQVQSIAATFLRKGILGPVIVVGHSMGALVAVELARKYPLIVKGLVLCSPPFYAPQPQDNKHVLTREKQLYRLYAQLIKHPDEVVALSQLAIKHKLVHSAYNVSDENIAAYVGALEASIVHQNALAVAKHLRQPIYIVHGKFDPVVIAARLHELRRFNPNVTVTTVLGAHELKGKLIAAAVEAIKTAIWRQESNGEEKSS